MKKQKNKKGSDKYTRTKFYKLVDHIETLAEKYEWGDEDMSMEDIAVDFKLSLLSANLYLWDEYPQYLSEDWKVLKDRLETKYPGLLLDIVGYQWYRDNIKETITEDEMKGWPFLVEKMLSADWRI